MEEMINFILDRGLSLPEWNRDRVDIEKLLERAKPYRELREYLDRYQGRVSELNLDDIVEDIQSGNGALSRIEKIFLFASSVRDFYLPKIESLEK